MKRKNLLGESFHNIRIGFFLATRQIRRASLWTTGLIVAVMVLTFLNLIVVSGILVGLIQGSIDQNREFVTSDVIISVLDEENYIENTQNLIDFINTIDGIEGYSARFTESVVVEANYREAKRDDERPNSTGARLVGINPAHEDAVTGVASLVTEGSFLTPQDFDQVVIGSDLLSEYSNVDEVGIELLNNVKVGTKIRLSVNGITREVTVKGIIESKTDVARNVFMIDTQARQLLGRNDGNVDEISILVEPGFTSEEVRDRILLNGFSSVAKVQTFTEALPSFLNDLINTFSLLGNIFSSVGLIVASITIFIVIFVNALTRRKFIGILQGIGIHGGAIEISYIFQSIFYAVIGSIIGLILLYGLISPALVANPIDFPFSDGILVAPLDGTFFRIGLLVFATLIAGYIPARMIVRKNTLDSILGRN